MFLSDRAEHKKNHQQQIHHKQNCTVHSKLRKVALRLSKRRKYIFGDCMNRRVGVFGLQRAARYQEPMHPQIQKLESKDKSFSAVQTAVSIFKKKSIV